MNRAHQDEISRTSPEFSPPTGSNNESSIYKIQPEILIIMFHIGMNSLPHGTQYSEVLRVLRLVSVRWSSLTDQAATLWAKTSCLDPEDAVEMALLSVACV